MTVAGGNSGVHRGFEVLHPGPNVWRIAATNGHAPVQDNQENEYVADPWAEDEQKPWEKYPLLSAKTLGGKIKPARWLVDGIWIERSSGVVAGKKKAFKTWQLHAMALSVATGKSYLDEFAVITAGPVIYLSGEGGQDEFQSRHQAIARRYGIAPKDMGDVPFYALLEVATLDDEQFLNAIRHHLDVVQPVAVYIDPLYPYHPQDIDISAVYSRGPMLARIRAEIEPYAALIIGDHINKSASDNKLDLDDIGYSGVSQWADSWSLQRHREAFSSIGADSYAKLEVEFGSRRTGSLRYDVDWHLVRDVSDGRVIKWASCDWSVVGRASSVIRARSSPSDDDVKAAIFAYIAQELQLTEEGEFHTKTEITKGTHAQSGFSRQRCEDMFVALADAKKLEAFDFDRVGTDGKTRTVEVWTVQSV